MDAAIQGRVRVFTPCIDEDKANADEVARTLWSNNRIAVCPECKLASVVAADGTIRRTADWMPGGEVSTAAAPQTPPAPPAQEEA